MNYYISDLHFSHGNIIKFDGRKFNNIEEMNETLINNWNNTITSNDTVYILGDFCWGKADEWQEILSKLKGSKVLIKGNHDLKQIPPAVSRFFADIKDYKEIVDDGKRVIMCHYPILAYKKSYDKNTYMLYGHVHNHTEETLQIKKFVQTLREDAKKPCKPGSVHNQGQLINVGCMMDYMNYTPRSLNYLIERVLN